MVEVYQLEKQRIEHPQNDGDVVHTRSDEGSIDEADDEPADDDEPGDAFDRTGFTKNGFLVTYDQLSRRPGEVRAMNYRHRFWKRMIRVFSCQQCITRSKQEAMSSTQIRIPPRGERGSVFRWASMCTEGFVATLQFWFNKTTFFNVIIFYLAIYLCFITIFGLILYWIIKIYNQNAGLECCTGFNFEKPTISENFDIVFELSWTTFSTVVSKQTCCPFNTDFPCIHLVS